MKRFENIDIVRSLAIITIVIYHCFALTNSQLTDYLFINKIVSYGGEIGVTLFFVLSGFGIACSIINANNEGKPYTWTSFMKKRLKRIVPQYYVCLFIMLIIADSAYFLLTKEGIFHIGTHLFFCHNLFVSSHGSINGAMWALATIAQFYLIALFLQKCIEKNRWLSLGLSVVLTILVKIAVFQLILRFTNGSGTYFFVYGRQLITALDNFVIGMVVANVCMKKEQTSKKVYWLLILILFFVMLGLICGVDKVGLYTNHPLSWCWHSLMAVVFGLMLYCYCYAPMPSSILKKGLLWMSKYEYGIYIWHMVIICNMINRSPIFQKVLYHSFWLFAVGILVLATFVGYFSTKYIDRR